MTKNLFNDLAYLLKHSHIKKFLTLLTKVKEGGNSHKMLEVVLTSTAVKGMYYQKVKGGAVGSYKGSFEQFYDKYLDKFSR